MFFWFVVESVFCEFELFEPLFCESCVEFCCELESEFELLEVPLSVLDPLFEFVKSEPVPELSVLVLDDLSDSLPEFVVEVSLLPVDWFSCSLVLPSVGVDCCVLLTSGVCDDVEVGLTTSRTTESVPLPPVSARMTPAVMSTATRPETRATMIATRLSCLLAGLLAFPFDGWLAMVCRSALDAPPEPETTVRGARVSSVLSAPTSTDGITRVPSTVSADSFGPSA